MYKLIDITKNITDGVHGDCENEVNSGYYFISVKDLEEYRINYDDARQITQQDYIEAHKRTKLEKGDVLFANSGHTIGKMLFVQDNNTNIGKTTFQKSVAIFKPNLEVIDNAYFYYLIKYYTEGLRRAAVGSAQKNLLLDDIRNFKVKINHTLSCQSKIVGILRLIDNKIDHNTHINAELEKCAKSLYDYWFVQFDFPDKNGKPYKSSGGKMVWNVELKRKIPDGWLAIKMNELLIKNTSKYDFSDKKHNIDTIDLSVMPSATICLNVKNSSSAFGTNLYKLNKYDILFGGIRPYLLKAGFAPFDGLVTGTVHSFKAINEDDYNYSLLTMTHSSMFSFAISNSKGTKMPVVGADDLLSYKAVYSKEMVKEFNECVSFKQIISHNILENQTLSSLRDWLLPMLMNGQVKVN
ncbi:MAG TPA: restriction endonuclease subunit S [Candidatus Wunengus sp. YC61]|uniref:restriction endonuclease subunit S n=1 Tax=Candidatus Wunengus sp. YC61 TaxID=3367698 RepID=UPI004026F78A